MKKLNVMMLVTHDGQDFDYYFYGDPRIVDARGNVTVAGKKGAPVKIEFILAAGAGVESVGFDKKAKKPIEVGPKGSPCPPTSNSGGEFDDEKPGKSDNVATIKDNKTSAGDGRYPYALYFEAELPGGSVVRDFCDPMFINT